MYSRAGSIRTAVFFFISYVSLLALLEVFDWNAIFLKIELLYLNELLLKATQESLLWFRSPPMAVCFSATRAGHFISLVCFSATRAGHFISPVCFSATKAGHFISLVCFSAKRPVINSTYRARSKFGVSLPISKDRFDNSIIESITMNSGKILNLFQVSCNIKFICTLIRFFFSLSFLL